MPTYHNVLSDKAIKAIKATGTVKKVTDGEGLYLRVTNQGYKTWYLDYINPITKQRESLRLGPYPELTLKKARKFRDHYRSLVTEGVAPKAYIAEMRKKKLDELSRTFEMYAYAWLEKKPNKGSKKHQLDTLRSFENHLFPHIGKTPIKELTPEDAINALERLDESNKLELIRRLCQNINRVMIFAKNRGAIEVNPLSDLRTEFRKPIRRHYPFIHEGDLPDFFNTLLNSKADRLTQFFIELKLHLITRSKDLASIEWSEIDWDKKILTIPGTKMKGNHEHLSIDEINERYTHSIPLSDSAVTILRKIKLITGNKKYVFASQRAKSKHINSQTGNSAIKHMGYKGKLVAHGLRSTASTTLNDAGFNKNLVEKSLSHAVGDEVSRSYNHAKYIERRRPMMNWWSAQIENAKTAALKSNLFSSNQEKEIKHV